MHPDPRLRWDDQPALRALIERVGLATISVAHDGRPHAATAPLVFAPDGSLRFHLARSNRVTPMLDGAPVLASLIGTHFYVSPDWYGTPDEVPTWNYELVEIAGIARRLDTAELHDQVDRLSALHEAPLRPKAPWTSAKMDQGKFDRMLGAISGFAIEQAVISGTLKMGQHKSIAQAAAVAHALRALGNEAAAAATMAARA